MPQAFKQHKSVIAVIVIVAVGIGGSLIANLYIQDFSYNEMTSRIIDSDRYLHDASVVERKERFAGKHSSDISIHLEISKENAHEMTVRQNILYDCIEAKKGCPHKTWQPYDHYKEFASHNISAIPTLTENQRKTAVCTMRQYREDAAYGLCIDPHTGDMWYRTYSNW